MKRILITALYYPPSNLIGAKRPHKIANFLSESGWDVTVLTVKPELTPPIGRPEPDTTNIEIIKTKAFVPYVALRNMLHHRHANNNTDTANLVRPSSGKKAVRHNIIYFLKHLAGRSLTALDQIDEWSGWRKPALRAMKKKNTEYDVVLSTIPPHSTAYLGMQLAAYYECKFVLDYRDPWSELIQAKESGCEFSTRKLKRNRKIEDECLDASDLILAVSPAITKLLRRRANKKILTVPQGFTGSVTENCYDKDSKYLLYAGSLAYGRDISFVLSAIRYLAETYHEELRLRYCGDDSDIAYEQANAVGATAYIDIRGSVQASEVLEFAKRSLCNIAIVSPGYEYSYPGKVFELITAGRPIYVISSFESEAGKLVEKYGIGHSIVGNGIANLAHRMNDEINAEYNIPSKVNDLRTENIYQRMLEEGLNTL